MKLCSLVGARPQFVKAAAVSRRVAELNVFQEVLVHSGQHYDANMSQRFFDELEIPPPQHNLNVGSGLHGWQTGQILERFEAVLIAERPDMVLVYGDTNSTLAGALAAAKLHIPVAHVEAGLRSYNRAMPEEINRILVDHASDLLFSPTEHAKQSLMKEGIPEKKIDVVGDVMYDASLRYLRKAKTTELARLGFATKNYVLATVHRAENTDNRDTLGAIIEGLTQVAKELPVLLPLHPRTRRALEESGLLAKAQTNLSLIGPVGYLEMLALEEQAKVVATDSGGVQKEAFFFRVPCVTLRAETEWIELVESGWNDLVNPTSAKAISGAILRAAASPLKGKDISLYGDGHAVDKIINKIVAFRR